GSRSNSCSTINSRYLRIRKTRQSCRDGSRRHVLLNSPTNVLPWARIAPYTGAGGLNMKRMALMALLLALSMILGFGAGMRAAGKAYQFTGTVKSNEGGTLTVEKSAKETWTFTTNKDTKGTAKVGDKVTVYYTMVATEIEAKAAPTSAKK